jgi:hypothetical protein
MDNVNVYKRGYRGNTGEVSQASEAQIQAACVIWFKNEFRQVRDLLYMVHNDGKKNPIQASQDLARGLTKGIPDLSLDIPNGEHHGLKIELKKPGEKPRPEQVRIHTLMQQMGYRVELIDNVEDFKKLILNYVPAHLIPPQLARLPVTAD